MNGHNWRLVEENEIMQPYNKAPILDYWAKYECTKCLQIMTETGYVQKGGIKLITGSFAPSMPCGYYLESK